MFAYFSLSNNLLYSILVDLVVYISWFIIPLFPYSLTCIHNSWFTPLFVYPLVFTCIETHVFIPDFLVSHIFVSILKFSFGLLLFGQIFTFHLQHSNIWIQHHIYTIFEKISSFSYFILSYTRLQLVTLPTRKGVLYSIF